MTADEKAKLEKMENSVERIQHDIALIKSALLGNELAGEAGIVGQMKSLKYDHDVLKAEVKALSEERVKNTVYVRIISWLLAVIGVGIVSLIFSYFK